VKSGHVSADYDKCDLVVKYEVEATVVGDTGKAIRTERKAHEMPLRVKLDAHTDCKTYAEQLVHSSDLIPSNKVDHVRGLLESLKAHIQQDRNRADSVDQVKRNLKKKKRDERDKQRHDEEQKIAEAKAKEELGRATIDDLDDYLEKLYDEDIVNKVTGTAMILALAKNAGNLEDLIENEALMGALSRTLKDDSKRSMELVCNIMQIFFSFSHFSQFHQVLLGFQVGNNTMMIIRWELKRYASRLEEMQMLQEVADAQEKGEQPVSDPRKAKRQGDKINMDKEESKTKTLQRKQDKLLFVCIHVLLNLAEDDKVEKKMAKRDLVLDLVHILSERTTTNTELLILTVTFLKKLSITKENKDTMLDSGLVEHLVKYVPCSNEMLMKIILRTLFNLSFDIDIREQMVSHAFIPKLADLLPNKQFRAITLKILYHISMDDKFKSMFTYTEILPYMMRMLIDFPANHIAKELAGLAVNLSLNHRICSIMCQNGGFKNIVERAIKRRDPLLMKVVRNISIWTLSAQDSSEFAVKKQGSSKDITEPVPYRSSWGPFAGSLMDLLKSTDSTELMIELLGTVSNLSPADIGKSGSDYADFIIENELVEFLHKHLLPGFSEDDIVLEVIILLGSMCLDEGAARLLSNSPLIKVSSSFIS